jgi:hypothetical protein
VKSRVHLFHQTKIILDSGLIREIVIWRIQRTESYPEGIRYRLLLADPISKKVLVLFDNHAPKGHHFHDSKGREFPYEFDSLEKLIIDFLAIATLEEKLYENSKN